VTASTTPVAFEDPQYREAVVDLLGAIAYGEISAFERLAEDAKLAPTLEDKVAIATMATVEFAHVARLNARMAALGADPTTADVPIVILTGHELSALDKEDVVPAKARQPVEDGAAADPATDDHRPGSAAHGAEP